MRPKTPKKVPNGPVIKVNLKKDINLEDVAEELKKIINDLNKNTDINKLGDVLRSILVDIYTFINKKEKNEKMLINRKGSEGSQENDKSLEKANSINDIKHGEVVNLNKCELINTKALINSTKILPSILEKPLVEGTYTYKSGAKYEGQMRSNIPMGKGVMYYPNGLIYEGEWKNGKKHGKGKYIMSKDKGDIYEGDFVEGVAEGRGTSIYSNGDRYTGEYRNWNKHGKGTYYYHNGHKYVGDFFNDKAEGRGIYYYKNGDIYEGEFHDSMANGLGCFFYKAPPRSGDRYEGNVKNFYKHGKGIVIYKNGDIYQGDFKLDKKEGMGFMYYANGDREIINYSQDKPVGKYVRLSAKGKVTSGTYN